MPAQFEDMGKGFNAASEQLRIALDTTMNGIIGLDEAGHVNVINPAARHMLDGKPEPSPFLWPEGVKFLDTLDLHPPDASADPINRALAGQVLTGETHLMTRENRYENRYKRIPASW